MHSFLKSFKKSILNKMETLILYTYTLIFVHAHPIGDHWSLCFMNKKVSKKWIWNDKSVFFHPLRASWMNHHWLIYLQSKIMYTNFMFTVHGIVFAWHISYKGQCRGMTFSLVLYAYIILILLISKTFLFGTIKTRCNQENMIYCFASVRSMQV